MEKITLIMQLQICMEKQFLCQYNLNEFYAVINVLRADRPATCKVPIEGFDVVSLEDNIGLLLPFSLATKLSS